MMKKSLLVLVVFTLLLSVVSAISISVEDPLTQGSQWSFNVEFNSLSGVDEGKIYVDSELALTMFEHAGQVFSADVSSKVLSYKVNGTSVVIAYAGLNEGVHTIEAKTYTSGSVNEEESVSVTFLRPLSQTEKDSLDNQISDLQSTTSILKSEVSALETTLNDKDSEINNLKQKNSELVNDIGQLELNISELESNGATNEEILMTVKDDLNILLTEREVARNNPIASMFAASTSNPTLLVVLIAAIAIIVIGVFVKKNSSSIYSSSIFSKNDEIAMPPEEAETKIIRKKEVETEIPAEEDEPKRKGLLSRFKKEKAIEESTPKRKWAVESYHPSENPSKDESKRFELGDLIKKE